MKKWIAVAAVCLPGVGLTPLANAGPWTLPRGETYATLSLLGTRSSSFFDDLTDRTQFANDGLSRVAGVTVEGAYGLTDALTVSAAVPALFYRLQDRFVEEEGVSLGDIRASARYRLFNGAFASSVEAAVKFPTATEADPARIQVGEGQYDVDLVWSLGWGRLPVYAGLDLGYRFRLRNGETGFRPGDEVIFRARGDYRVSDRLWAGLALDGFWGQGGDSNAFGLRLRNINSARRLAAFVPSATYWISERVGLDLSASFPVLGRNYYAGSLFTVGFTFSSSKAGFAGGGTRVPTPRGGSCCTVQ